MPKSVPDRESLGEGLSQNLRNGFDPLNAGGVQPGIGPVSPTDDRPSPIHDAPDMPLTSEAASPLEPQGDPTPPGGATRRRRPFLLRGWVLALLALGAGVATGGVLLDRQRQDIIATLPNPAQVLSYARPGTLTILAKDGTILQKIGPATRDYTPLTSIPLTLQQAFLAAEDRRFYEHTGVDYQAIARALKANFQAGEVVEGGSTITQQLARIVFLDQDPNLDRKVREALLAQKMEQELTKQQILERYLNLVYLGAGAYGVADAAWIYFGKSLQDLTLGEMATLAGLPPAPSIYSPLSNPKFAEERRVKVLDWMLRENYITAQEAADAKAESLTFAANLPKYQNTLSPYFTTFVTKELAEHLPADRIEQGGLVLETSLNLPWQTRAETNLRDLVAEVGAYQNFSQAAFVALNPQTGAIEVMVGGADFESSQFNRVTQAQRQPGSTFKTFVYTTAIAAGFSPHTTYVDAPFTIDGYRPKNYGGTFRGTVSLVEALVSSINIVSLKTLLDVGFEPIIDTAHKMGLQSQMKDTYSLALGAWEMNLLEMTSAYGTLANQGLHIPPHGIMRILTDNKEILWDSAQEKGVRAVDADSANIMTWMLQQVVDRGTGGNARLDDRPVAGKTGTSESARDLWFIGYIPQLAAGVWLGNDDNRPTWGASSSAALLWGNIVRTLIPDLEAKKFPPLPDLQGRKPTLKAQPVKPAKITEGTASDRQSGYEDPPPDDSYGWDNSWQGEPEESAPSNFDPGFSEEENFAPGESDFSGEAPADLPAEDGSASDLAAPAPEVAPEPAPEAPAEPAPEAPAEPLAPPPPPPPEEIESAPGQ